MVEVSRPITVLIILIMMTGVAAEDIQDVRGFVYKQAMGSAKVSYDSIEVVIKIDINELAYQYKKLTNTNLDLETFCKNEVVIKSFNSCKNIAAITKLKLEKIEISLNNLIGKKRQKRAINEIGRVVKILFGNLDDEDARRYERNFKIINKNEKNFQNITRENFGIIKKSINFNSKIVEENIKKSTEKRNN